jgi:hypothetical protein
MRNWRAEQTGGGTASGDRLITLGIIVCRQTGEPTLEGGPERPVESPGADLEQTVSGLALGKWRARFG